MKVDHCEQEADALEAVRSGRWPDACEAELRAHVGQCAVCSEVVMVAEILRQGDVAACAEAHLTAPGLLWWKAQIRARRRAAERAAEPINFLASVTAVAAVFSLAAFAAWQWSHITDWWKWLIGLPFADKLWRDALSSHLWPSNLALVMSLGLCITLASFVVYLVLHRE